MYRFGSLVMATLVAAGLAYGKEKEGKAAAPAGVAPGDKAPAFSMSATGGGVSLKDYNGRWLVLVFYPKAFAPRDKAQMASLREAYPALRAMNAAVLGVSMDPLKILEEFRNDLKLPFALACDAGKSVSAAYGALGLGDLFSARKTVIVDPQGKVAAVLDKIREKNPGEQVVEAVRALQPAPNVPQSR